MAKNEYQVDLNNMRLFVSVVQAGSLTKAAELLNIPKSHLSRHLTELEASLGTRLMDRGRQGIRLNALGQRFLHNAQQMLSMAQLAIDDVVDNTQKPKGLLRISVPTEIEWGLLMQRLPKYFRLYPEVNLEVQIDSRKINLVQDGIDIALRAGAIENENVVAKKLFDIEFGLFASESYLTHHARPQHPKELYQHSLLHKYDGPAWCFSQNEQRVLIEGEYKLNCNDFNLVAHMASEGLGIALLPHFNQEAYSNLVRLLPDWAIEKVPLYAVYYKNRGSAPTVRSMVEFLVEEQKMSK